MVTDRLKELIDRGKLGENIGIPTGIPGLDKMIDGVQKATVSVIAGSTGSGKTSLTIFSFVYKPLRYDPNFHVFYYSLEMSAEMLFAKLMGLYLEEEYGIVLPFKKMVSRDGILDDSYDEYLEKGYSWLREIEERFYVYDKSTTGIEVYSHLRQYFEYYGKFKEHLNEESYTPNDPKKSHMVIIDHVGLLKQSLGGIKAEIDAAAGALIYYRNKCKCSCVFVQQINRKSSETDRAKLSRQEIELSDLKDSGGTAEAADQVIALFYPFRENMREYRGYDMTEFKHRFRSIIILKNRYGELGMVPASFFGEINLFRELPKPEELDPNLEKYLHVRYTGTEVKTQRDETKVKLTSINFKF